MRESVKELPSQFCNANICAYCGERFIMGITVLRVEEGWVHPSCAKMREIIFQRIAQDKDRKDRDCSDERRECRL